MCGRFALKSPSKKLATKFKVEEVTPLTERYNVAPARRGNDYRFTARILRRRARFNTIFRRPAECESGSENC
jgi:putative SOS response-associated peptidase YedK